MLAKLNCCFGTVKTASVSCAAYILKLGNALGGLLAGTVIQWAGFDNTVQVQAPRTIFWFRSMLACLPVAGLILVIFFILRVDLTKKKCQEIRAALEQRRGTV